MPKEAVANKVVDIYNENKIEFGFITKDITMKNMIYVFYKCRLKMIKNERTKSVLLSTLNTMSSANKCNTKVIDIDVNTIYDIITNNVVNISKNTVNINTIGIRLTIIRSVLKVYTLVTGIEIADARFTTIVYKNMFIKKNPNVIVIDNYFSKSHRKKNVGNNIKDKEYKGSNQKMNNIKIIGYEKEHLFSSLKKGDCFILKQDSELYMKTKAIYANRVLVGNACKLSNGDIVLLSDVDEFTKVAVDITATVC